jgi:hypothetical protein
VASQTDPGLYAVGDGANIGIPKAGVFAEGEALATARALTANCGTVARRRNMMAPAPAILNSAADASVSRGGFLLRPVADRKLLRAVGRLAGGQDSAAGKFLSVSERGGLFTVFGLGKLVARARIAARIGYPIHLPAPQGRRGMLLMSAFVKIFRCRPLTNHAPAPRNW